MNLKINDEGLILIMKEFGRENNITVEFPFRYYDFLLDERMQQNYFRKVVKVLQGLENVRIQMILCESEYDSDIIQRILFYKHPLLEQKTLKELQTYFYDWKTEGNTQPTNYDEFIRKSVFWNYPLHSSKEGEEN